jgi:transposase
VSYCTTETTLFVSLDIGKNVHWLGTYAGFGLNEVRKPLKVKSDRAGFGQVTDLFDELIASGSYDQVILGHEPTGIYHEAWGRALAERYQPAEPDPSQPPVHYQFVNPLTSKKRREAQNRGRYRKTDRLDLKAIALALRDGEGQPAFLATGSNLQFQLWGKRYRQTEKQRRQASRTVLGLLDRLWPGAVVNVKRFRQMHPDLSPPQPLVLTHPLDRKLVRVLLTHAPNPYHLQAMTDDQLLTFLRTHLGRGGPATVQRLRQALDQALLPPTEVAALLASEMQTTFAGYLALAEQIDALITQAETLVPGSPAQVLTTIPGVSPFLAARYLAHLGHPQRFTTPDQVWAFAGLDLVTHQSGDTQRLGQITRKGNPALRDTLFLIGFHTRQHVPAIGRAYQRATGRGLGPVAATLHAAHKANRLCQRMLFHQRPFDPQRLR